MARNTARRGRNVQENITAVVMDKIEAFNEFCTMLAPALRKDIVDGLTAEQIYAKYTSMAAARGVSIAMVEPDSGKALSAIKEILDRTSGRPVERVRVQHRFQQLSDNELDALLESRAKEVEAVDGEEGD